MKPVSALEPDEARRLRGLLFDLDDTLLSHGVAHARGVRRAVGSARRGMRLVAVTGRPSGWGEVIARQWPIDGAVDRERRGATSCAKGEGCRAVETCDEDERRARRMRLAQLVAAVAEVVPEARLTDDVDARRSDVTWDIGERVRAPRGPRRALLVARSSRRRRARDAVERAHCTRRSTPTTRPAARSVSARASSARTPGGALARYAFVGDSGNDAACFAAFRDDVRRRERARARRRASACRRVTSRRRDGRGVRRDRARTCSRHSADAVDARRSGAYASSASDPTHDVEPRDLVALARQAPLPELQARRRSSSCAARVRALRRRRPALARPRAPASRCARVGHAHPALVARDRRAGGDADARVELLLQRAEHPPRRRAVPAHRVWTARSSATRARRRTRRCSSSRAIILRAGADASARGSSRSTTRSTAARWARCR